LPPSQPADDRYIPETTLVIAAYNEADYLEEKIKNCFELNYPKDKLHILIITDGTTDHSSDIISQYPCIKLLHQPERMGKTAALNRAMQHVLTPLVIFCDANTLLNKNSIVNIVQHYTNTQIGGVAGEKRILSNNKDTTAGRGEGAYWKYESWLKRMDSEFYSVVGAAGELFSMRTALYEPLENDVILDDFVLSMRIAIQGYRVVYEPGAYASEEPSANIREEQKRKIRISSGAFQAMEMLGKAFNIFKFPRLAFQFISHRVLRWTLAPLCLLLVSILNFILVTNDPKAIYYYLLMTQVVFYMSAYLGYLFSLKEKKINIFYIPYYFIFMNISVLLGFQQYQKGSQTVIWEKAQRRNKSIVGS
jgi:cellulose synthase/poly-beta-1,6-N-acetylglucosamine synthase-like glycosyltransferase